MNLKKPSALQITLLESNHGSQVREGMRDFLSEVVEALRKDQMLASANGRPEAQSMAGACLALEELAKNLTRLQEAPRQVIRFQHPETLHAITPT